MHAKRRDGGNGSVSRVIRRRQRRLRFVEHRRRRRRSPPPFTFFSDPSHRHSHLQGASICDVHKILGFCDPLSPLFAKYKYCLYAKLGYFLIPPPSLRTSYVEAPSSSLVADPHVRFKKLTSSTGVVRGRAPASPVDGTLNAAVGARRSHGIGPRLRDIAYNTCA